MKKLLTLSVLIGLFQACLFAQVLPDPGFESWGNFGTFPVYEDLNDWNTLNSSTSFVGQYTAEKTTDKNSGSFAIKLTTKSIAGQTANGIATTGDINVINQNITGGIPYTMRPDSFIGFYKCEPETGDFGTLEFILKDANSDTVGKARFETPSSDVTSYTRFSAPIIYNNGSTPTEAVTLFSSSNGYSAVAGSVLYVDDVDLVFNPTSVQEPIQNLSISLYPNPAISNIMITASSPLNVTIYDMVGNIVDVSSMVFPGSSIDISNLPSGVYILSGQDDKGRIENRRFTKI
ncbi:MAG: T9SS type A sorting domain-containing protein [Flavobacteriales bacterium]|nr:T9SS type A sorting domain-containing protein [Flavobacteriales bacterium]